MRAVLRRNARLSPLLGRASLSSESTLVNLEPDRGEKSNIGRNAVADREGDEVARNELIGKKGEWLRVAVIGINSLSIRRLLSPTEISGHTG